MEHRMQQRSPRSARRSARRRPPSCRRARTASRRSCGRWSLPSRALPDLGEVLLDHAAILGSVETLLDHLARSGQRDVDRLATDLRSGALLLRRDVATGPGQQFLLLDAGLLDAGLALALGGVAGLGNDRL